MMSFYKRYRTLLLAIIAAASFAYAAVFVFDVDPRELGGYFFWSVVGLLTLAAAALLLVACWKLFKSMFNR